MSSTYEYDEDFIIKCDQSFHHVYDSMSKAHPDVYFKHLGDIASTDTN